jgi:hypothetical protein
VQLEAAVDDHLGCDQFSEAFWIELPEFRPLGEVEHHLGAKQRLLDAGYLGKALPRWQSSLWVIDPYVRPAGMQLIGHSQRRRVASVISARLERRPQHCDSLPGDTATSLVDSQFGKLGPLTGVDGLH